MTKINIKYEGRKEIEKVNDMLKNLLNKKRDEQKSYNERMDKEIAKIHDSLSVIMGLAWANYYEGGMEL